MKLELKNVSKTFGTTKALDDFSVVFEKGTYGILGCNGAGKSTMINLITDNIARETGEILYDDVDIRELKGSFRSLVGYMPQQQGFYEDFSARAFVKYMAQLKGIRGKKADEEIDRLLSIVNLGSVADKKIGGFSGGMKQRVLLAQALLGNPEILILDEPTAGLDPKERIQLRNYISGLSANKIILYTTHVMSDIECIADKVLIMKNGHRLAFDSPAHLIELVSDKICEVPCTLDEAEELQKKYKAGSIHQKKDGMYLRIVDDVCPEGFVKTTEGVSLEDVYLYYLA